MNRICVLFLFSAGMTVSFFYGSFQAVTGAHPATTVAIALGFFLAAIAVRLCRHLSEDWEDLHLRIDAATKALTFRTQD